MESLIHRDKYKKEGLSCNESSQIIINYSSDLRSLMGMVKGSSKDQNLMSHHM